MSIGNISGGSTDPSLSQKGNQTVTIRVTDAKGGYVEQKFVLFVGETVVQPKKPVVNITSPANGTKLQGKITLSGTAAKAMAIRSRSSSGSTAGLAAVQGAKAGPSSWTPKTSATAPMSSRPGPTTAGWIRTWLQ